ncbi:MAG: hypothetical protein ACKOW9_01895 [Candidatus Paceibacterota bacterium]
MLRIFLFALLFLCLFSCAVPSHHIAGQASFQKDKIRKEDVANLEYIFYSSENAVFRRVRLTSRKIEKGILYEEIVDSIFTIKSGTSGVLKYIHRDDSGVDNFYIGLHPGVSPFPFAANNKAKEFTVRVQKKIKTSSGYLPAVLLYDSEGNLKEAWVVDRLNADNRLLYAVEKKKKVTNIVAEGEKIKE